MVTTYYTPGVSVTGGGIQYLKCFFYVSNG